MPNWDECKHEWEDDPYEMVGDVRCKRCHCPGVKDDSCDGGVFWPAT